MFYIAKVLLGCCHVSVVAVVVGHHYLSATAMAHLAAAWPEQKLCKENKRKAILEQQRKWLEQRAAEQRATLVSRPIAQEKDEDNFDDAELHEINGFIADVGQVLVAESPPPNKADSSSLQELLEMGFTDRARCLQALEASGGDLPGAVAALCAG